MWQKRGMNQPWIVDTSGWPACPRCHVEAGEHCVTSTGHTMPGGKVHAARDALLMQEIS